MLEEYIHDGKTYTNVTPEDLALAGVNADEIENAFAADIAQKVALAGRDKVRSIITKNVADTPSLVGTVADGVGVLIAVALADIVALENSTTFANYKTAKMVSLQAIAGDADMPALASAALAQIQSGDVVLTASLKGLDGVITESLVRSTGVATILKAAQEQAEGE